MGRSLEGVLRECEANTHNKKVHSEKLKTLCAANNKDKLHV